MIAETTPRPAAQPHDPSSPTPASAQRCNYTTHGVWDFSSISQWKFHYDTTDSGVSDLNFRDAMFRAYSEWTSAVPEAKMPQLTLERHVHPHNEPLRPSSRPYYHPEHKFVTQPVPNGRNEISFPRTFGTYFKKHYLSETTVWMDHATGLIKEVDIVLHDGAGAMGFYWTDEHHDMTGYAPRYSADLQSVLTCQLGHALGLMYSTDSHDHTMSAFSVPGDKSKTTLQCGDRAGIRKLYVK